MPNVAAVMHQLLRWLPHDADAERPQTFAFPKRFILQTRQTEQESSPSVEHDSQMSKTLGTYVWEVESPTSFRNVEHDLIHSTTTLRG